MTRTKYLMNDYTILLFSIWKHYVNMNLPKLFNVQPESQEYPFNGFLIQKNFLDEYFAPAL